MKIRLGTLAVIMVTLSWSALSWGGPTRKEEKQHISAWQAFASDLSRGDCAMASLSDQARVTLPTGQGVSKEEVYRIISYGNAIDKRCMDRVEQLDDTTSSCVVQNGVPEFSLLFFYQEYTYRLACVGSMADATVGGTSIAAGQLVAIDVSMFSVETTITTEAIAPKDGTRRRVSYPAAFFLEVDPVTNKVTGLRMYAQNMALLAARGYAMVPDDNFVPVIRPA